MQRVQLNNGRGEKGGKETSEIIQLNFKFAQCPIQTALRVLGKKWTLLILRDIGFRKVHRFNRLLESVSGITPRVLSMRLKELELAELRTQDVILLNNAKVGNLTE